MKEHESLSKSEVIQLVSVLTEQEKHFNGLETNYRLLSSTWLLGSLGTIGYILISTEQLTIDFWLLIGLIGGASGTGVVLLWILDVKVYHKLLNSVFIQGILLEIKYDWLPKVRTDMLLSQKGDVTKSTNLYYTLSSLCLYAISLVGFINYSNDALFGSVIGIAGTFLVGLIIVLIWKNARSERSTKLLTYLIENYQKEIMLLTDLD